MIGGLQGEFGDLDIKYLKQNISRYLKMSIGNIRKLQENTVALYTERKTLRISFIRRSGYVYPEKLKRPPLHPAMKYLDVKCRRTEFRIWNVGARNFRINSIRIPPRGRARHAILLSPDDNISYPDMVSGWKTLTKVSKPCYSPRFVALQWCVRTPCSDIFCHGFQRTLFNLGLLWW